MVCAFTKSGVPNGEDVWVHITCEIHMRLLNCYSIDIKTMAASTNSSSGLVLGIVGCGESHDVVVSSLNMT
jgi:hypothetical protein